MSRTVSRAARLLRHHDCCLFILIGDRCHIRLDVLRWMFHQLVRPVSITVFLPTVCRFQGNLYPFDHCRIKENILIISNTVLCQGIRVGNIFYLRIQILSDQILSLCFGHIFSEVNSLLVSIIFQCFLGSFFLVCIHRR